MKRANLLVGGRQPLIHRMPGLAPISTALRLDCLIERVDQVTQLESFDGLIDHSFYSDFRRVEQSRARLDRKVVAGTHDGDVGEFEPMFAHESSQRLLAEVPVVLLRIPANPGRIIPNKHRIVAGKADIKETTGLRDSVNLAQKLVQVMNVLDDVMSLDDVEVTRGEVTSSNISIPDVSSQGARQWPSASKARPLSILPRRVAGCDQQSLRQRTRFQELWSMSSGGGATWRLGNWSNELSKFRLASYLRNNRSDITTHQ